jgi:ABC-type Fe3+/spermidine/putrescine transport system ATPase subunit
VAEFIGRSALARGTFDGRAVTVVVDGAAQTLQAAPAPGVAPGAVLAVLRPDALAFTHGERDTAWPGVVVSRRFAGTLIAYHVLLAGQIDVELHSTERAVREGDAVRVRIVREPVAVVSP